MKSRHFLFSFCILAPKTLLAHPLLFYVKNLPQFQEGKIHRKNLVAMGRKNNRWEQIPLQIEEMEHGAQVVRTPQTIFSTRKSLPKPRRADPYSGYLHNMHRITIEDQGLQRIKTSQAQWLKKRALKSVCQASQGKPDLYWIQSKTLRKEFILIDCPKKVKEIKPRPIQVNVQMSKNRILGKNYAFHYENNESLLPTGLTWGENQKANILIRREEFIGQVRKILDFEFTDQDVKYYPTSYEKKPLSSTLEVASEIKLGSILSVDPIICCDVSFYNEAITFPVILDTPVPGRIFSRPSGVFVGLQHKNGTKTFKQQSQFHLPHLKKQGFISSIAHKGFITFENETGSHVAVISLGGDLKEGIYPSYAENRIMNQIEDFPIVKSPLGVYYDITGLKSRQTNFEVWLFFGKTKERKKLERMAKFGQVNQIKKI